MSVHHKMDTLLKRTQPKPGRDIKNQWSNTPREYWIYTAQKSLLRHIEIKNGNKRIY